jgi:uncharacterized protein
MDNIIGQDIVGRGWKFPIRVNGSGGLSWSSGADSIREAIWIILATPRRSRIMLPDFGCGIHDFLFAPNSANTRAGIEDAVKQALTRWEPRVDVTLVRASSAPEDPAVLLIEIETRVRSNNAALNLVYPFYLTEGIAR